MWSGQSTTSAPVGHFYDYQCLCKKACDNVVLAVVDVWNGNVEVISSVVIEK